MADAVVLAAGRSERFGTCKALAPIGATSWLRQGLDTLQAAGIDTITCVLAEPWGGTLRHHLPTHVYTAWNHAPELGLLESLRCGLVPGRAPVVVWLIDHPAVTATTVRRLLEAAANAREHVWVPTLSGRRGHPIVLGDPAIEAVRSAPRGARLDHVTRRLRRELAVDDPAVLHDWDDARSMRTIHPGSTLATSASIARPSKPTSSWSRVTRSE